LLLGCGSDVHIGYPAISIGFDESPVGLWKGSLDSDAFGYSIDVVAVVSPDHEVRIASLDKGIQYTGFINMAGSTGRGDMTGYAASGYLFPNGQPVTSGEFAFTVIEGFSISGEYTSPGDEGTVWLSYNGGLEYDANIVDIAGWWGYWISPYRWLDIDIDESGTIAGLNSSGCQFDGGVVLIDDAWGIFDIELVVSNCAASNGIFVGLASVDYSQYPEQLLLMVSTPNHSYVDILEWQ